MGTLVVFAFFAALLLSADNVIAQNIPSNSWKAPQKTPSPTATEDLSSSAGPKKLPSPTDPIKVENIKVMARSPVWSPLGNKIAFIRLESGVWDNDPAARQLYVIEENGDNPRVIASISNSFRNFCWSPDGKKIAFVENDPNDSNIYTIDLATKARVQITNHKEHVRAEYGYLAWSPDGTKLAFSVKDGEFQIWIADAQGKFWFKLTDGFNPVWFPNSKRITFATGEPSQCSFFIIDVDGKNLTEVKNPSEGAFSMLEDIAVSPDSKYIFCTNTARLNVAKPDGSQPTTAPIYGDRSSRLPSILGLTGQMVAVVKDDNVQILNVNKLVANDIAKHGETIPAGAVISRLKVPNLSPVEANEIRPRSYLYWPRWSWSPDNKTIAFVGKDNEIWKVSINGTTQKQLTFERTKLVQLAQKEQEKKQALAQKSLESELGK